MTRVIRLEETVTASKQTVSCDLNGGLVALDIVSGVYYGLEGVGCEIWKLMQQPRTAAEIVEQLMSTYDVPRNVCEQQTIAFLQDMAARGLITVGESVAA